MLLFLAKYEDFIQLQDSLPDPLELMGTLQYPAFLALTRAEYDTGQGVVIATPITVEQFLSALNGLHAHVVEQEKNTVPGNKVVENRGLNYAEADKEITTGAGQ